MLRRPIETTAVIGQVDAGRQVFGYPREAFTILVWGLDHEKFGTPEDEYKGLRACVTGKITSFRGRPEIVASEREQIEIQE
jgi:hypothetical protein